jgi:SAM-dependent methyltransferase
MLGRSLRHGLGWYESEPEIVSQAQRFWSDVSKPEREDGRAHWRGRGVFANDDERWLALGANNLRIFEGMVGEGWLSRRPARVVDWGCGGGCNAVHFGVGADRYHGVDITAQSLDECETQMQRAGLQSFVPVLLEIARPEYALECVRVPCDLVLSTYVFEVIPTKNYGERLLRVMAQLLRPDGLAFIQIKYSDSSWSSRPRPWNYERNMCNMTTYRIDEFWTLAARSGFRPEQIVLEPEQELVHDRRYAYFLLRKLDTTRPNARA